MDDWMHMALSRRRSTLAANRAIRERSEPGRSGIGSIATIKGARLVRSVRYRTSRRLQSSLRRARLHSSAGIALAANWSQPNVYHSDQWSRAS